MFRILIVEDDSIISEKIKGHLEKWGYEVESVRDFADVLQDFIRFDPQLVLMDIGLPVYLFCLRQYEYCNGYQYGRR